MAASVHAMEAEHVAICCHPGNAACQLPESDSGISSFHNATTNESGLVASSAGTVYFCPDESAVCRYCGS
jgi:hypothetical protein